MVFRLKEFSENTIREYKQYSRAERFADNEKYPENSISEDFQYIGNNFSIPYDYFESNGGVIPEIPGITRGTILGEESHFLDEILNNKYTKNIDKIKKNDINGAYLSKWVGTNTIFILPVDILYGTLLKNIDNWPYIRWIGREVYLLRQYPLIDIVQSVLKQIKDKIIIYEKNMVTWYHFDKYNEILDREERLFVNIDQKEKSFRVTIETINKIEIKDHSEIKYIEILD
jgi:hypothetical protein